VQQTQVATSLPDNTNRTPSVHVEILSESQPKSPQETVENSTTSLSSYSFHMQLINVTDEVVPADLDGVDQQSIISPFKANAPDVTNIMASPGALLDPTLQKEIDFMKTWLARAEAVEVPFAPYLSKSQKKKTT